MSSSTTLLFSAASTVQFVLKRIQRYSSNTFDPDESPLRTLLEGKEVG